MPVLRNLFSRRLWKNLTSPTRLSRGHKPTTSRRRRLEVEALEDRTVPAVIDLTAADSSATINGAIIEQDIIGSGSGNFPEFVSVHASPTEQGYNTNGADEFDTAPGDKVFQVSTFPIVDIGGTLYRQILLDVNQENSDPLISLEQLRIHVADVDNLSGYNLATGQLPGSTRVYDLDAGGDNQVILVGHSSGSGDSDYALYLPVSIFPDDNDFLYLFSRFGSTGTFTNAQFTNEPLASNDGFDEWGFDITFNPALNIVKTATVPGGTADVAGEVISYSITVQKHWQPGPDRCAGNRSLREQPNADRRRGR